MAVRSLKAKLLLVVLLLILVAMGGLALFVKIDIESLSAKSSKIAANTMRQEVLSTMDYASGEAAQNISGYINQSFTLPSSIASILSNTSVHSGGDPIPRNHVRDMIRDGLASYEKTDSIYIHFEPDGYDGQDAKHINQLEYSTTIGTLEQYVYRDGNELLIEEGVDPDEKYLSEINENGQREAEWYLCSRDTMRACTLEPYLYEIEPGRHEIMTSLVAPVIAGERFRGIVGVDITLPELSRELKLISSKLYGGKGQMLLLSEGALLVASSDDLKQLGKPLASFDSKLAQVLTSNSDTRLETEEAFVSSSIIQVGPSNTQWRLVYSLPKNIALQSTVQFQDSLTSSFDGLLWKILTFIIVTVVVAGVLLSIVIKGITSPLVKLGETVSDLSGAEGDLTRELNITSHKELIEISDGFNAFTRKLREMILTMKGQAKTLRTNSNNLAEAVSLSAASCEKQAVETESVAAAMNEMSQTASQVAQLAQSTLDNSSDVALVLKDTQKSFDNTLGQVKGVSDDMIQAGIKISVVADRSNEISGIVNTIRGIAEQTNLLALNAAIEAARAGEQGRGFAVVADEVRTLAERTQHSTKDIEHLIKGLQSEVYSAVEQIDNSKEQVAQMVIETQISYDGIEKVVSMLESINDDALQVATAAAQQHHVSDDINRNVSAIGDAGQDMLTLAKEVENISQLIDSAVVSLDAQLSRLKV
ncbi:methyl-accepting chemotaxis protein [Vibrio alfacsensis]|uniref:methyl-accepting chemotaxis protein n=1 Tax=Vibrio alfacsensis TaxID=1074311 RepID=UPI004067F9EC